MGYIRLTKEGYKSFFYYLRAKLLAPLCPIFCTLFLLGVFDLSSGETFELFLIKVLVYWLFSMYKIYWLTDY